MGEKLDIVGKKYNRLTVIEEDMSKTERYPSGALKHYYKCLCECGNTTIVSKQALISNHTKSCGCAKRGCQRDNLVGQKFNRLTVVKLDEEKNLINKKRVENGEIKNAGTHWICRCECGNTSSVAGYQLRSGHTKSCGCYQSELTVERNRNSSTKVNRADRNEEYIRVYSDTSEDFFIVDLDDYEYISRWFWRKDRKDYWVTNAKMDDEFGKGTLRIHQLITNRKYDKYDDKVYIPDHLNRNKSDNRKCNIELKTIADNARNRSLSKTNRSGKTGVHWAKDRELWTAYICVNYKNIYLGVYREFDDAVSVRIEAEEKYGYKCDDILPDNATEVISYSTTNL